MWVGVKETSGNDPQAFIFTDGSTHDYIPPDVSLNDGAACVRLTGWGLADLACETNFYFICMSDLLVSQGKRE